MSMEKKPKVSKGCFVHPDSRIIGDVWIGDGSSVWPYAVIRGDENSIRIGKRTSVQDGGIIHVDTNYPVSIGDDVTIGHGAIVHGCTVGNRCIIGIRSTILNGAVIGDGCIIGAGAVVPPNSEIPPHSMVLGVPGKVKKSDPKFEERALENASIYVKIADEHRKNKFTYFSDRS